MHGSGISGTGEKQPLTAAPDPMSTIRTPRQAALSVLEERGWQQGEYGHNTDGAVCMLGAIRVCHPVPGDAFIIEQVWKARGRGTDWNDDECRTVEQVMQHLQSTPAITDDELCSVFGPQWRELVALIRRAAVITQEEAERIHATCPSARTASWTASRIASMSASRIESWTASRIALRIALRSALRIESRIAATYAATNASAALVVRDVIGQHGFTQQHYDTLTRPWRTFVGKLHPEDKEWKA